MNGDFYLNDSWGDSSVCHFINVLINGIEVIKVR